MRFAIMAATLSLVVGCRRADDGIDYAGWPELTSKPYRVDPAAFSRCTGPTPAEKERAERRSPHHAPAVRVYANSAAAAHLREGHGPLPVGAVVIKEKWWDEKAASPHAYAAMIKRDAGFDPDHGDWEYVYVTQGEDGRRVQRGRIASCVECHERAVKSDYLFRHYLQTTP